MQRNMLIDDFEFDDINNLADIFPDIEPYLDDFTESFNEANRKRQVLNTVVDTSDSDSGISGDSLNKSKTIKYVSISNQNTTSTSLQNNLNLKNGRINYKFPIIQQENKSYNKSTPIRIITNDGQGTATFSNRDINILDRNRSFSSTPVFESGSSIFKTQYGPPHTPTNSSNLNTLLNKDQLASNTNISRINSNSLTNVTKACVVSNNPNATKACVISNNPNATKACVISNKTNEFLKSSFDLTYPQSQFPLASPATNPTSQSQPIFSSDLPTIIDAQQVDRLIKKQERMIKNRQAASLSRQRKKEYMERLESKVEQQRVDNQILQNQIVDAREKIYSLEQENITLKTDVKLWRDRYYDLEKRKLQYCNVNTIQKNKSNTDSSGPKRKLLKTTATSTTILGIFILIAFNFQVFSPQFNLGSSALYNNAKLSDKGGLQYHRMTRKLMSVPENATESQFEKQTSCNGSLPNNMNHSDSIRLSEELHSWSYRYKHEYNKIISNSRNKYNKPHAKDQDDLYRKMFNKDRKKNSKKPSTKQLELVDRFKWYRYFYDVINDIGRNPDTLYFVSLHSDNWIYPASPSRLKNNTNPKITLLLPANAFRDNKAGFKMMKIDCDVRNFTVLNIYKKP